MGCWQTVLLVDSDACRGGPWFRWTSVGIDIVAVLAGHVSLEMIDLRLIGKPVVASLAVS
jgi:anti-sigma-K factor RskA